MGMTHSSILFFFVEVGSARNRNFFILFGETSEDNNEAVIEYFGRRKKFDKYFVLKYVIKLCVGVSLLESIDGLNLDEDIQKTTTKNFHFCLVDCHCQSNLDAQYPTSS